MLQTATRRQTELAKMIAVKQAAGAEGLKVEKIARHVYNSCNSIFTPLNYKDVHSYVTQYLTRCAKDPQSLIEKGKGYGVYHVNFDSKAVQQLMLNFSSSVLENSNEGEDKADDSAPQSLFDENMF